MTSPATADETVLSPAERDERVIARTRRLAETVLAPHAAEVDARCEIPRSHLSALAEAGLFGMRTPAEVGGTPCSALALRACMETLAAADGSTYFVWIQHQLPLMYLKATSNTGLRDALLPDVARGRVILGQALSHLAKPGKPSVTAVRAGGGWRLTGTVRWYTGWGLNDLLLAGATAPDGRVVIGFIDPRSANVEASAPLPTSAMRAAQTVTLELRDVPLNDDRVAEVAPMREWLDALDGQVDVPSGIVGVAAAAVSRLGEIVGRRGDGQLESMARTFEETLNRDRARAYAIARDSGDPGPEDERLALKAALAVLAVEATTALVVAEGGNSMLADSPAQRWAREALFYLVHAQTPKVRDAQARHISATVTARESS